MKAVDGNNAWTSPGGDGGIPWPLLAWRTLPLDQYRAAFKSGALHPDIYFEQPPLPDLPTVVFIHGSGGSPAHYEAFAARVHRRANCAAFVWDYKARLAPTAETLRAALVRLPSEVLIVAHSMGALLPAYLGATDDRGLLRNIAAIYLNPLIGGSRYAGDFRAVAWLGVGPLLTRAFLRPSFLDLAPESEFQQTIFARNSSRSSFAARTTMLFTERPRWEPSVPAHRIPYYFGWTRPELLAHVGSTVEPSPWDASGHEVPLRDPRPAFPLIDRLLGLRGPASCSPAKSACP